MGGGEKNHAVPNSLPHVSYSRAPASDPSAGTSTNLCDNGEPDAQLSSGRGGGGACRCTYISVALVVLLIAVLLAAALAGPLAVHFWYTSGGGTGRCDDRTEVKATGKIRLPTNLWPRSYDLHVKVYMPAPGVLYDPDLNFTFDGELLILFECRRATKQLVLNAFRINITKAELHDFDANVPVLDTIWNEPQEQVTFELQQTLKEGRDYQLSLTYRGQLQSDLTGLYKVAYEEDGITKYLAVSQGQPHYARRILPCFDEPVFKADFVVAITHPAALTALSNSIEVDSTLQGDGWKRTEYKRTPKMSSYLLAMVISEFKHRATKTKKGTLCRVWARPMHTDFLDLALNVGPKILEFFESYFDLPFPLEKQDMVAIPDFEAGAMENWGLIMYRDLALLYNASWTPAFSYLRIVEIITHEVAHQWFGNLVTMNWWNDLWLNEGFATYLQFPGVEHLIPGFALEARGFSFKQKAMAMARDELITSHPLVVETNDTELIYEIFDAITYDKGATLVRMLRYIAGTQAFRSALRAYLSRNQYGSASQTDLFAVLTEQMRLTRGAVQSWCHSQTLYVPLWYTAGLQKAGERKFFWLTPSVNSLTIYVDGLKDTDWLLMNPHGESYARFAYDEKNWHMLTAALQSDHTIFSVNTRTQLVSDAFALARTGLLNYTIAMNLTYYLRAEREVGPWHKYLDAMMHVDMMLEDATHLEGGNHRIRVFTEYFRSVVEGLYDDVGSQIITDVQRIFDHLLRALAWKYACRLDNGRCIGEAQRQFNELKRACPTQPASHPCNTIDPNLRETVYCVGVRHGSKGDWEFLWDKMRMETAQTSEKSSLISGLACSNEDSVLTDYIGEVLQPDGPIRMSEAALLFQPLAEHRAARQLVWKFVSDRWPELKERYSESSSLHTLLIAATEGMTSVKPLEEFLEKHKDNLGKGKLTAMTQLEKAKKNSDWVKNYAETIVAWCKAYNDL